MRKGGWAMLRIVRALSLFICDHNGAKIIDINNKNVTVCFHTLYRPWPKGRIA